MYFIQLYLSQANRNANANAYPIVSYTALILPMSLAETTSSNVHKKIICFLRQVHNGQAYRIFSNKRPRRLFQT